MKEITQYMSNDGSVWDDRNKAKERDSMISQVESIMSYLTPHPTNCGWEGYVQQSGNDISYVKMELFEIANREGILKYWIDDQINSHGKTIGFMINEVHPSFFGRVLDGRHKPLENAYHRLCCIDDQNREWNQPFFANNPDQGKQEQVG